MAEGHWNSVRTLSTLEDVVVCPVCGSKRVGATSPGLKELPKTVKRKLAGRSVSKEEEKEYRKASFIAELVTRYGKKALVVLAGRGVGPQRASRILRPGLTDRLMMLREIADAEREYARTRPFWGD
jgi:ATP-dependent Lhr-like helicase